MMTAEQLKGSILQLAIQGKLVNQESSEGKAVSLIQEIKKKKQSLIKQGIIKKEKELSPIAEDEIPFDIPETWEWVRLGDYAEKVTDYVASGSFASLRENAPSLKTEDYAILVKIADFSNNFTQNLTYTTKHGYEFLNNSNLFGGELVLSNIGSIGKVFIVPKLNRKMTLAPNSVMVRLADDQLRDYLYHFLLSPLGYEELIAITSGTAMKKFNKTDLKTILIPIPPLEEQKRIVAKIEELMPFVEQYAVANTKLNTLNATFPEMMKKSILQEALQGKLVPQDPNDEPASLLLKKIAEEKKRLIKEGKIKKQKPLPEITEDEIPFDIPESWEWIRLSDISKQITDGEHSTPKRVSDFCGFYLLSARNVRDGEIKLDDVDYVDNSEFERISSRCNPVKGDILITCSGSVGRCAVVNDDNKYVMVRSAAMASPIMCDPNYLMYAIQSDCVQRQINALKKQTAQANLFLGAIAVLKLPLPPYNEQKRIVSKLNQVLSHTEKAFNTLSFE